VETNQVIAVFVRRSKAAINDFRQNGLEAIASEKWHH